MNLFVPEPTRYDVNFRLFGVSVRVTAGFSAVHLALGVLLSAFGSLVWLALWPPCAFVSVLVHELGHVLVGRAHGARGEIILTAFGGLAGAAADVHERRHRILVYAAGPLAQLLFAGVLALVFWRLLLDLLVDHIVNHLMGGGDPADLGATIHLVTGALLLVSMNVGMALFNLLPVPPLDGSKILEELAAGRHADREPWERAPDWWKRR